MGDGGLHPVPRYLSQRMIGLLGSVNSSLYESASWSAAQGAAAQARDVAREFTTMQMNAIHLASIPAGGGMAGPWSQSLAEGIRASEELANSTGAQLREMGHTALRVMSAVPVVGVPFAMADSVWSLAEGDPLNAGLSFGAAALGVFGMGEMAAAARAETRFAAQALEVGIGTDGPSILRGSPLAKNIGAAAERASLQTPEAVFIGQLDRVGDPSHYWNPVYEMLVTQGHGGELCLYRGGRHAVRVPKGVTVVLHSHPKVPVPSDEDFRFAPVGEVHYIQTEMGGVMYVRTTTRKGVFTLPSSGQVLGTWDVRKGVRLPGF
jgi:hypothetical protein